jgi:hypothetical protein
MIVRLLSGPEQGFNASVGALLSVFNTAEGGCRKDFVENFLPQKGRNFPARPY